MKDFMPPFQKTKKLVENVLQISQLARNQKVQDNSVINATAGSYYTEAGDIKVFDIVKKHFENPSFNKDLSYTSVSGSKEFQKCVFEWIIGKDNIGLYESYYKDVIATPGGTGAISMAFATYLEKGEGVLLPNLMWPAYLQIAKNLQIETSLYNLYNEKDEFDINNLEQQIILSQSKYDKVFIVINDPCHNPTGFVMNSNDYKKLVELLNKYSNNTKIVLLMDIAYLDYSSNAGAYTRENFKELTKLNDNVKVMFAFSASKTFGLYGLRCGALVHITKEKEESQLFNDVACYHARSTWSNSNHLAINIIEEALNNQENQKKFQEELKITSANLVERASILTKYLDENEVPYAPYNSGFFILLLIDDINFDKMLEEHKVYGCRFGQNYRIALSSISKEESKRLGKIIGNIYQKIKKTLI